MSHMTITQILTPSEKEIANPIYFLWSFLCYPASHVDTLGQNPRKSTKEEIVRQKREDVTQNLKDSKTVLKVFFFL